MKIGFLLLLPLLAALVSILSFHSFLEETRFAEHFTNVAGRQRMLAAEPRAWAHMVSIGQEEEREQYVIERIAVFFARRGGRIDVA